MPGIAIPDPKVPKTSKILNKLKPQQELISLDLKTKD
jgi:hypothetical protein